jgi:hypothetical protein
MAFEQLQDALEAYFKSRYHSAIVLAAAAEQLFAGYLLKHGLQPAYTQDRSIVTRLANALREESDEMVTTEKDIGDLMNKVYNHSKHAGKTDLDVWMNARDEAHRFIDRAISNYDQLFRLIDYDLPDLPLAQQFRTESIRELRNG